MLSAGLALPFSLHAIEPVPTTRGPLRVHPTNPRYFTDDSGRAVLLTGSHTWNNLVDVLADGSDTRFDYDRYLAWMAAYPHNFMRLWTWELLMWDTGGTSDPQPPLRRHVQPHPWRRTGPGLAADGRPKFDLTRFDDEYFDRLRTRVQAARERGIYTAVMLFEGWGLQFSPDAWRAHPMHPDNNINDINGDLDGDGKGLEVHTGQSEAVTQLQRAYVRHVIDTLNDLDNVLYEISNENHPPSTAWQYEMIRFIHAYEATKPHQHPVGMTFQYQGGTNETLWKSPADWISPNPDGGYRDDPPAADGAKVILNDTDHLWGIGGNATWVWRSFLRGLHPVFMDPYHGTVLARGFAQNEAEPIRRAMGHVLAWSRRVDLASLVPRPDLASSKYCLAAPGETYLALVPAGDQAVTMELSAGRRYSPTWFNTVTGEEQDDQPLYGPCRLESPFDVDTLLFLRAAR
jgi:hypothetical protein